MCNEHHPVLKEPYSRDKVNVIMRLYLSFVSEALCARRPDGYFLFFFFSSRRRHTRLVSDWSSDVCSSDLLDGAALDIPARRGGERCSAGEDARMVSRGHELMHLRGGDRWVRAARAEVVD